MIIYLKIRAKEIRDILVSMSAIREAILPESIPEVTLNLETARNALQSFLSGASLPGSRSELIFHAIDPASLPGNIPPEILEQIPASLVNP